MLKIDLLKFEGARYERKFLISELKLYEIENIIKLNPKGFSEIFNKRQVNNIYLDSLSIDSYHNSINGEPQRLKIRIRWYGELFGVIKNSKLELKIKNNELGTKLLFPLTEFKLDSDFSADYLYKKVFLKSELPEWLIEKLKLQYPILINCYKRKYFICGDKVYNITLDNDLTFFRVKSNNNSFNEKIVDKKSIILELKSKRKDDRKISDVTEYFPFRLTKSSKYITGINLLYSE